MTATEHRVTVSCEGPSRHGALVLMGGHRAHCSCGWSSDCYAQMSDTDRAVEIHLRRSMCDDCDVDCDADMIACKHFVIRYVLTDAVGADGIDDHGRPYRDICLSPEEVFSYAAAIGSNFKERVVEAMCVDCGAPSWGHLRSCP